MLLMLVLESTHVDRLIGFLGDLSWELLFFGVVSTLRNRSLAWVLGRDLLLLRRCSSSFGAELALFIAMLLVAEEELGGVLEASITFFIVASTGDGVFVIGVAQLDDLGDWFLFFVTMVPGDDKSTIRLDRTSGDSSFKARDPVDSR